MRGPGGGLLNHTVQATEEVDTKIKTKAKTRRTLGFSFVETIIAKQITAQLILYNNWKVLKICVMI